jgi:hypothetical protein
MTSCAPRERDQIIPLKLVIMLFFKHSYARTTPTLGRWSLARLVLVQFMTNKLLKNKNPAVVLYYTYTPGRYNSY